MTRRSRLWMLVALLCGVVAAGCDSGPQDDSSEVPPRSELSRDEAWQVEVQYLADELARRHEDAFFYTSETAFRAAADALEEAVPDLTDAEVTIGMMRLAALIGDAHTSVDPSRQMTFHRFPLRLKWFDDGVYVVAAGRDYASLVGARLVAVEGQDAGEVLEAVRPVVSHENEHWFRELAPEVVAIAEVLHTLGALPDVEAGRFTFEPGGEVVLPALAASAPLDWAGAFEGRTPPLYLRSPGAYYWYAYLPEARALYVHYRRCADQPGYPFEAFVDEVKAAADTLAISRTVIDLRLNTGGNSAILRPLLRLLTSRPAWREEGLYALIGRRTFSSGMLNAVELRNDLGAVLVGRPTGGAPNGFGEVRTFTLPYSRYVVHYSTKFFALTDGAARTVQPDRLVTVSSTDYFAGRDPVLGSVVR